ncbi:PTS sugar transporter subunit IIA [Thiocystis violacea]|uniref:PTS sugar transporter subunit IIA n=1 Tax=Thiocystis violacea TaxID=13725 RepID=UPI001903D348|nr:PTS sugar transporter subunit IIA [Thiocystis violacea]MBK1716078.1 PTS fructose transporter subunit IIA [Thiocystis violacea]
MSVGLLLVTHRPLAGDLLRIASEILGHEPPSVACCEVINDTPPEELIAECLALADRIDQGQGVLVLTDLYGSTPANVARALAGRRVRARVIAGLNLPMLLRALNYAALDLDTLAGKALEGGRDGVRPCEPNH